MAKKVVLVGHCGPDMSYLKSAVYSAIRGVTIVSADDDTELKTLIAGGVDLVLVNRQLEYGFSTESGIELIASMLAGHPDQRMMLISNYPEAQAEAVASGALHGFGKREIGSPRVAKLLQEALTDSVEQAQSNQG